MNKRRNKMYEQKEILDRCTCKEIVYEEHTCPFLMDVENEFELPKEQQSLCTCCPYCEQNCADNVYVEGMIVNETIVPILNRLSSVELLALLEGSEHFTKLIEKTIKERG